MFASLTIHQSNRLEELASLLAYLYSLPKERLFEADDILIASSGMKRYIDKSLASQLGVASNIRYSRPASFFWRLMKNNLAILSEQNQYAPEILQWRLLALFQSSQWHGDDFVQARSALNNYLYTHQSALYDLAVQLANIYDQYLVFRPQWIEAWSQNQLLGLGDDEVWQMQIWQYLQAGINTPHRIALWQEFEKLLQQDQLDANFQLPERIFVFGVSSLAPMHLALLKALSKHTLVHLLVLNPCAEYWGDIITPRQILNSPDDENLNAIGHPLLMSLGQQGKDFFYALSEYHPNYETTRYINNKQKNKDTLLHCLQYDIQTLSLPSSVPTNYLKDGSIIIHIAHSALRELQILKNNILYFLEQYPHHSTEDIIVLSPNIDHYLPYIEAIFGKEAADNISLPYNIADTKINQRQIFLSAISALCELMHSRFEVSQVRSLLENEYILNRFELNLDDIPLFIDLIKQLNIHWAWDNQMRSKYGDNSPLFTWKRAIERLILGTVLADKEDTPPLWHQIAPFTIDINLLPNIMQFTSLLGSLFTIYEAWQKSYSVTAWISHIKQACHDLMGEIDDHIALNFYQHLNQWQEEVNAAHYTHELTFPIIYQHLQAWLKQSYEGRFLRGGITFCSMVPMRSLPFPFIALLGMNDGDFPRDNRSLLFDLIHQHPQRGDRSRREDDRYLFLETLMSCRDVFYLSYIGKNIRNDEALAPSSLVNELLDIIAKMANQAPEDIVQYVIQQHPLQSFSTQYFRDDSPRLISYRQDYMTAYQTKPSIQIQKAFLHHLNIEQDNSLEMIHLSDFLLFWKNPSRYWLRKNLSWSQAWLQKEPSDTEPFIIDHEAPINYAYLQSRKEHRNIEETQTILLAQNHLPSGFLSDYYLNTFKSQVLEMDKILNIPLFDSTKLAPYSFCFSYEEKQLTGYLNNLYPFGQVFFCNQKPNAPQKIEYYLLHLIANAVMDTPQKTYIAYPANPIILHEILQNEAQNLLQHWLYSYQIGQTQALPFFAKTSLAVAEKWADANRDTAVDKIPEKIKKIAYNHYHGNQQQLGQGNYTEEKLLYGKESSAPIEQDLFWNLIATLLQPLLKASQGKTDE